MSVTVATTTTPLLTPIDESSSYSRFIKIARLIRRVHSHRIISDQSLLVRQSALQQVENRRRDWSYSTPVVALDLNWNTVIVLVVIVVVVLSKDEVTNNVPLRLWIVVYGVCCVVHMVCVIVEFRRRREAWVATFASSSSSSSSSSMDECQDENHNSIAKHLESTNTAFSFIWWMIGIYWISSGGRLLADVAPKLFWLTSVFLVFDVFFLVLCIIMAFSIGIAVCCCLPCLIAILYTLPNEEGTKEEIIETMTRYNFRRVCETEKPVGEIQESYSGIMAECDTDTPIEHALSADDAACAICVCEYESGSELYELPCHHHFHCACIDKWLHTMPGCPLCKYNIPKNGNQSSDVEL